MSRRTSRARPQVKIELQARHFTFLRIDMELRNGKVLLQISPEAMANTTVLSEEEKAKLMAVPPQLTPGSGRLSSVYTQLQTLTRGYLWLTVAALILILAAGVLLFPQKAWNRMMLAVFGCVTFHIRGKAYRFCEQPPAQDNGGIAL